MKVETWIKYEESYLPPRCRKLRYCECEDFINVTLKEVNPKELKLAFEDNSYDGKGKIYLYKNKLWAKQKTNPNIIESVKERDESVNNELDYLLYCHKHCNTFFYSAFDRECKGIDTSRMAVIKKARNSMKNIILVNGELYCTTAEPRYCIVTFGLGHNHGGTGMFCDYHYNPNISKDSYFSALDGEIAVKYANETAARRGDTKDVGKFKPFITCHMPELVKINPKKQHGNGNDFHNMMESVIENSSSQGEAAVVCMALSMIQ